MLTTTDVAERYLNGLGMSAEKNGVDIMLCMSFPNVLMHSVNLNSVSHGRGSTDSHTRHNSHGYPYDNWKGLEAKAHYYGPLACGHSRTRFIRTVLPVCATSTQKTTVVQKRCLLPKRWSLLWGVAELLRRASGGGRPGSFDDDL